MSPIGVSGTVFGTDYWSGKSPFAIGIGLSGSIGIAVDTDGNLKLVLQGQIAVMMGEEGGYYAGIGFSPGYGMSGNSLPCISTGSADHFEINAGFGPAGGIAFDGVRDTFESGNLSLSAAGAIPRFPGIGYGVMKGDGRSYNITVAVPLRAKDLFLNNNYTH